MPHQSFIEYFTYQFEEECLHICRVFHQRNPRRSNFTDIFLQVIGLGSHIPTHDPASLTVKYSTTGISKIGTLGYNYYEIHKLEKLVNQIIPVIKHLKSLAKSTAHSAAYQYEYAITQLIDKDSLPTFAYCGVKRMFEYIIREQLPFTPQHLLIGLVKGKTGAGIEGLFNTSLKGQQPDQAFHAEDLYARAAARTPEGLWANPDRQNVSFTQASIHVKVNDQDEPVAGYYWTNIEFVKSLGYERFSPSVFSEEISRYKSISRTVNERDFSDYMQARKRGYWGSFNHYIGAIARFDGQLENIDLSNGDFSHVDFSGAQFKNCNLNHCSLEESLLVSTTFSDNTTASWACFQKASLYQAKMSHIDFDHADFEHTDTNLADFTSATMTNIRGQLSKHAITQSIRRGGNYPVDTPHFQPPYHQSFTDIETQFEQAFATSNHYGLQQVLGVIFKQVTVALVGASTNPFEPLFSQLPYVFIISGWREKLECTVLKNPSADDTVIDLLWQRFSEKIERLQTQCQIRFVIERKSSIEEINVWSENPASITLPSYLGGNIELYTKAVDALRANQTTHWHQLQHALALWLEALPHDEKKSEELLAEIQNLYIQLPHKRQIDLMQQLASYPVKLFDTLAHTANPNGWHYHISQHRAKWRAQLLQFTNDHIANNNTATWQTHDLRNEENNEVVTYALTPELYNQLLTPEGEFKPKPSDQAGRHWVLPLRDRAGNIIAWAKILPESPAEEFSAIQLMQRTFGSGYCPETLIVKLHVPNREKGKQDIAIQLSEHLPGETFDSKNVWDLHEQKSFRFDSLFAAWGSGLIFLLGDANPGNLLVEEQGNALVIRQFDWERVFFPSKNESGSSVQNLAWCLDEMQQPWPMGDVNFKRLLNRFLSLDIYSLLSEWITILKNEHAFYQKLFTEEEFLQHFSKTNSLFSSNEASQTSSSSNSWFPQSKNEDGCLLTLPLGGEWLYEIGARLSGLQIQTQTHMTTAAPFTTLTLLKQLHPSHYRRYQEGFDKLNNPAQLSFLKFLPNTWSHLKNCTQLVFNTEPSRIPAQALPWLRFHYISHGEYTIQAKGASSSVYGNKAKMLSQSLKLPQEFSYQTALEIRNGTALSPKQADERLQQIERANGQHIIKTLLNTKETVTPQEKTELIASFYRLPHRIRMELIKPILKNIEQEKAKGKEFVNRILQLMKGIPFIELDLTPFSDVLNDKELLELVTSDYEGTHLVRLTLAHCIQLTHSSVNALAHHVPNLTHLDLSGTNIPHIACEEPGAFPCLKYLNINNNKLLHTIKLLAPWLENLDAKDC